jgi:hypothetical protein
MSYQDNVNLLLSFREGSTFVGVSMTPFEPAGASEAAANAKVAEPMAGASDSAS